MATYFVSRHERAHFWMKSQIERGRVRYEIPDANYLTHLDVRTLAGDDIVIGTLPFKDVMALQSCGAQFVSLVMDLPEDARGRELSATEMSGYGARLLEVEVVERGSTAIKDDPAATVEENWPARKEVRIAFVSDQLMPLFLAAQQYRDRIDLLVLVTSKRMQGKLKMLRHTLTSNGWSSSSIEQLALTDDGDDYAALLTALRASGTELQSRFPDHRLVADLTGGTKPMALALERLMSELRARGASTRCIYTNSDAGAFQWISPMATPDPIAFRVGLTETLALQGKKIEEIRSSDAAFMSRVQQREPLTLGVMPQVGVDSLGVLNHWCSVVLDLARQKPPLLDPGKTVELTHGMGEEDIAAQMRGPRQAGSQKKRSGRVHKLDGSRFRVAENRRDEMRNLLVQTGVVRDITFAENGSLERLELCGIEATQYLGGGWLEEWAWLQVSHLGADEIALGVTYRDELARSNRNEIDLAVVHNNRLLIIEAKTANFGAFGGEGKAADALYALDSKSHALSQLFASRVLLSRRSLDSWTLLRAQQMRISVLCDGTSKGQGYSGPPLDAHLTKDLSSFVRSWMATGALRKSIDDEKSTSPFRVPQASEKGANGVKGGASKAWFNVASGP